MKSILSYFVNCEDSSATQQLSDQNGSANMPSPSLEAFTSDESRKETGERVLKDKSVLRKRKGWLMIRLSVSSVAVMTHLAVSDN